MVAATGFLRRLALFFGWLSSHPHHPLGTFVCFFAGIGSLLLFSYHVSLVSLSAGEIGHNPRPYGFRAGRVATNGRHGSPESATPARARMGMRGTRVRMRA